MNKLLLSLLMIVLIASMTLVACSDDDDDPVAAPTKTVEKTVEVPAPTKTVEVPQTRVNLDLQTSSLGSTLYTNALALALAATKSSGLITIDPVSNSASSVVMASFANEDPSDIRQGALGIAIGSQFASAKSGTGKDGPAYTTGYPIVYLNDVFLAYASIDDNINTMSDLDGKDVVTMYGPVGDDYALISQLIGDAGISVNESFGSGTTIVDQLMDGLVDVVWFGGSLGEGTYEFGGTAERLFTLAGSKLNVLQIQEQEMQAAMDAIGYAAATRVLPTGFFDEGSPKADVAVSVTQSFVFADETMSEDVVYEFVKAIAENLEAVGQYSNLLTGLTAEKMYSGLLTSFSASEIHPGAVKYYQEIGVVQ